MILSVPEDILVWGCKISANTQHLSCDLCVDVWLFICLFVLIFGFSPNYWRERGQQKGLPICLQECSLFNNTDKGKDLNVSPFSP